MPTKDYSLDRGLPASLDAERSVLGAILLDNAAYYDASDQIRADHFSLDSHRRIYARISEMIERSCAADIITLSEELRTQQQLEAVGGVAYLASLTDGIPPRANIGHYVKIVKDKSLLRSLINASNNHIARALEQSETVEQILSDVEADVMALTDDAITAGFLEAGQIIEQENLIQSLTSGSDDVSGLATGFHDLDQMTCGLQPADLIIIAARPSMGKTAFAMNVAENVTTTGERKVAAVFSLEMSRKALLTRMACSRARVDSHNVRTGFLNKIEIEKIGRAIGDLMEAPLFIDDTPGISVMEMRAKLRRLKQQKGRLDLVIVDYLQLMSSPVGQRKFQNRTEEVSQMSRGLKLLAKELNTPLVALSQLSRAPEQRTDHEPQLSDLRESGSIEQDADVVGFIFRPEVYEKEESRRMEVEGEAELNIAKQRNGPTGKVHLAFIKKCTRFESRAIEST